MHAERGARRHRGSRPGRAGGRHLARAARRRDDARRAPRRAVLAAPRDRGEPALDGADPLLGRRGRRPRRRRRRRVARMAVAAPWPRWPTGSMWPSASRRASRPRCSARPRPPACPRTTSSPCCSSTCAPCGAPACTSTPRWSGVEDLPEGVEVVLRDVASGAVRTVRARYLVAADGAHSRIRTALGHRHARTRRARPRRHGDLPGAVVAGRRRAPLRHLLRRPPAGRGTFLPPAAATAGTTGRGSMPTTSRATRRSGSRGGSEPAPASTTWTSRSSAPAPSASPPSSPTASAPATSSSPETPPIG